MIDDGTLLIANSTVIAGIFIFMAVIATLGSTSRDISKTNIWLWHTLRFGLFMFLLIGTMFPLTLSVFLILIGLAEGAHLFSALGYGILAVLFLLFGYSFHQMRDSLLGSNDSDDAARLSGDR